MKIRNSIFICVSSSRNGIFFFLRYANEIRVLAIRRRLIYDNKIKAIRENGGEAIDRKDRAIKFERRL